MNACSGRARIEYLRSHVSLLDLANRFTRMHRYGRAEWCGVCPFHPESNPSFFVNVETVRFFCHGCQAGGDLFRFLEILLACDFREAVRQVARLAKGKSLSLPVVGLAAHGAIGARGSGGWKPPEGAQVERMRAARDAHRRAVAAGAARALLARYEELPASIRADWDAGLLLVTNRITLPEGRAE